jgi:hypothetical protein
MSTAKVYRPVRDWKGQRPKELEDSYIGDVTGVIVGGAAPQPLSRFPSVMTTEGQLGIPFQQDSGIKVDQHDLLVISGEKYYVQGERQWEDEHVFGGADIVDDYYWVEVKATA